MLPLFGSLIVVTTLSGEVAGPEAPVPVGEEPPVSRIYGGEVVASCGWPSAAYLSMSNSACTGTLIHPRIVLTAAHCVADDPDAKVKFGEQAVSARVLADTEYCKAGPQWGGGTGQGTDYGYCKLMTPVLTVPIIPVAEGCEQDAIHNGARIMHVGFGVDENGDQGIKKMLDTTIDSVTANNEIISGDPGKVICNGDSGGPTYVWMDPAQGGDGTWRVAAIHSWAQGADPENPNCANQAGSVIVWQAIDWIEQDSGIDITPCHDGDQWNPTFQCQGFPQEPWTGGGNYTGGCEPGPAIGFSDMCGPPLDSNPDTIAPVVAITSPADGTEFQSDGGTASVQIVIEATDDGWGMASIDFTIRTTDGQEQDDTRTVWDPWVWDLSLPPGGYIVTAIGHDNAGNTSDTAEVAFGVDQQAPDPDDIPDDTGTGSGTGTGGGPDGTGGGPGDDGDGGGVPDPDDGSDKSGCGCAATSGSGVGGWLGLVLLALPIRRRRR